LQSIIAMTYFCWRQQSDSRGLWRAWAAPLRCSGQDWIPRDVSGGARSGDKSGLCDENPGGHIRNRQILSRLMYNAKV
jgi:hypothetical protein